MPREWKRSRDLSRAKPQRLGEEQGSEPWWLTGGGWIGEWGGGAGTSWRWLDWGTGRSRVTVACLPGDWIWLASMAAHQTQERLVAGNETLACAPLLLIQLCAVWAGLAQQLQPIFAVSISFD
jgi:hypothetical protein